MAERREIEIQALTPIQLALVQAIRGAIVTFIKSCPADVLLPSLFEIVAALEVVRQQDLVIIQQAITQSTNRPPLIAVPRLLPDSNSGHGRLGHR